MKFLLLYLCVALVLGLRAGGSGRFPRGRAIAVFAVALAAGFSTQFVIG